MIWCLSFIWLNSVSSLNSNEANRLSINNVFGKWERESQAMAVNGPTDQLGIRAKEWIWNIEV